MEGGIEKYFLKIYSIQLLSSEHLNGYQTFNRLRVRARLKFLKIIYTYIPFREFAFYTFAKKKDNVVSDRAYDRQLNHNSYDNWSMNNKITSHKVKRYPHQIQRFEFCCLRCLSFKSFKLIKAFYNTFKRWHKIGNSI